MILSKSKRKKASCQTTWKCESGYITNFADYRKSLNMGKGVFDQIFFELFQFAREAFKRKRTIPGNIALLL